MQRKRYVVDLKTRNCNITEVTEDFHPIEVPEGAHFERELSVGLLGGGVGAGVAILEWRFQEHDPEKKYSGKPNFSQERIILLF